MIFSCVWISGSGFICGPTPPQYDKDECKLEPAEDAGPANGLPIYNPPPEIIPPITEAPPPVVDKPDPPSDPPVKTPEPKPAGPWSARDYNRDCPLEISTTEYSRNSESVCTKIEITNQTENPVWWWEANTPYLEGSVYEVHDARNPVWEYGRWSFQPNTGAENFNIPINETVSFSYCSHW